MDVKGSYLSLIKDLYAKSKGAVTVNKKRTELFNYTKRNARDAPEPSTFQPFCKQNCKTPS